jgi:hypothetical protein
MTTDYKQRMENAAKDFFDLVGGRDKGFKEAFETCVFKSNGTAVSYHTDYTDVALITRALNDKVGLPHLEEDRNEPMSAKGAENHYQARDIRGSELFREKMKTRHAMLSPDLILARGQSLIQPELEIEVRACKDKYDKAVAKLDAAQKPINVQDLDDATYKFVMDDLLRNAPEPTLSKIEEAVRATPADPDGSEWQVVAPFADESTSGRMTPEVVKTIDSQVHPSTGKFTIPRGHIGQKRKWLPVDHSGDSNDARFQPRTPDMLENVAKRIARAAVGCTATETAHARPAERARLD